MEYLDFEKELEELDLQIKNTKEAGEKTNSDMTKVLKELKNKYNQKKKKNLSKFITMAKSTNFTTPSQTIHP